MLDWSKNKKSLYTATVYLVQCASVCVLDTHTLHAEMLRGRGGWGEIGLLQGAHLPTGSTGHDT